MHGARYVVLLFRLDRLVSEPENLKHLLSFPINNDSMCDAWYTLLTTHFYQVRRSILIAFVARINLEGLFMIEWLDSE